MHTESVAGFDPGHVVIVGAGAAGSRFAQSLRSGGFEGPVTLLGAEEVPPYHRPLLSKDVLKSLREIDEVLLCSASELAEQNIDFRPGSRVLSADPEQKVIHLESGDEVSYDTLVIATGVQPRPLGKIAIGRRVHSLHNSAECMRLRDMLGTAKSVAMIGSGFIGSEIAATITELGRQVHLISVTQFPLQEALGSWVGERVARMHLAHGVHMHMEAPVVNLDEDDEGVHLEFADGAKLSVDVAIVGIGSMPATMWLEGSGLEIVDGVMVDEHGRTADPNVWAVGDVARRRLADGSTSRVEHWTSATEQADALSRHFLGKRQPSIPRLDYLWTDLYGTKIQMLGHIPPGATEHILLDEADKFVVGYTLHDRLVAVVGQGVAGRFMRFRVPVAAGSDIEELRALAAGAASQVA